MEIPRSLLDGLTDRLNTLSEAGQQLVRNALANAEWETAADLREAMINVMDMVCGAVTDDAAALTADFYDEVRTLVTGKPLGAVPDSQRVMDATEERVRSAIQFVVEGKPIEKFRDALTARVDYEIKLASNLCMASNAERDPLKPRWARVPTGLETCSFCLMLASFGAHYNEKDSISHVHANCDCRMVSVFDGMTVEGHDPDRAFVQTEKCLETIGGRDGLRKDWEALPESERTKAINKRGGIESKAFDAYVNKRLAAEMSTRDLKWLRTGIGPVPSFATAQVARKVLPHELRTANRLGHDHGIACRFIQDYEWVIAANGQKRKMGLPDLEDGTELKTIQGSRNAWGAMDNNLSNSQGKKGLKRVIVDNTEAEHISDSDLIQAAEDVWKDYSEIPSVFILTKTGKLVLIDRRK